MKNLFLLLTIITLTTTSSFASSDYDVDKASEVNYTQSFTRADGSTGTTHLRVYLGETSSRSTCILRAYAQLDKLNE